MSSQPRSALVFGGTGQIGAALLARLRAAGWYSFAVSRQAREEQDGIHWLRGEFDAMPVLPEHVDVIFSTGPLDRFSRWYADARIASPRVVAFGSTSVGTKHDSSDAGERDLAVRLQDAEARVFATASARGAHATILRPTLVYGAGSDQTLSRIAAMARRSGFFVLPANARGGRQPVHVADLAAAAQAVVDVPATHGQAYALPGGETVEYREMVRRTLSALAPTPRLIVLPSPLFALAVRAARATGRLQGLTGAAVARMREDLVFDAAPARRDFGYAPRGFRPDAGMLPR
nr:nucleoside-diphosphate sugar epimerase [Pseudoxanthomonas sp.]